MRPVTLQPERLVLDLPLPGDRDRVVEYCRDPVFERFMVTPWPYEPQHAEGFLSGLVPNGWADDTEYTWALRDDFGGPLLGVIGFREQTADLGYWLGRPHRGQGLMTEAVGSVLDWLFAQGRERVAWECIPGNAASASVARKAGFRYLGEHPSALGSRDGLPSLAWHAELRATDNRDPKPGWPA
jgi:RimJ/RimL family protein N-acetyltransferase